jgi:hypothetical protein
VTNPRRKTSIRILPSSKLPQQFRIRRFRMDARFYEVKRCMFCSGREAKKEMPAKLAGALLTNTISLGIESPEKFPSKKAAARLFILQGGVKPLSSALVWAEPSLLLIGMWLFGVMGAISHIPIIPQKLLHGHRISSRNPSRESNQSAVSAHQVCGGFFAESAHISVLPINHDAYTKWHPLAPPGSFRHPGSHSFRL